MMMVRYSLREVVHNVLCVEIPNVVHLWLFHEEFDGVL